MLLADGIDQEIKHLIKELIFDANVNKHVHLNVDVDTSESAIRTCKLDCRVASRDA